jgi:hypothetical protein
MASTATPPTADAVSQAFYLPYGYARDDEIKVLKAGNARFMAGQPLHPHKGVDVKEKLRTGQTLVLHRNLLLM